MATNPNLNMPSYEQWVEGGTYQTGQKLDPKDKNMQGYYQNYKKEVKKLIDSGNLAQAKATVETLGHGWNPNFEKAKPKEKPKKEPVKTPTYDAPTKKETPAAEARPAYTGPVYDPSESITPTGITLEPVQDGEFVENRLNDLLDKNSPLFRNAAESRLRQMAGRGLGRNASMAQEEVMKAVFAVAGPIAEADARMLERHRTLNNTAYHQQMNTRLQGVIQKALTHIAGGYDIQAATMKDITDRWKTQVDADLKEYGIDVSAAVSRYGTDVGFEKTKYVADIQKMLGLEGIKINAAQILAGIEDNAEATAYIWDLIFGENLAPGKWLDKWKKKWEAEV